MVVWMLYNLRNVWRIISTQSFQFSPKQDVQGTKTEQPVIGTTNQGQIQTNVTSKQDNVTIKGPVAGFYVTHHQEEASLSGVK